ncbi:Pentatricopeptide repeat-containing protein [Artemisia annua]|uniref:Pentatricopeptide repeat-containing protein n=1 Tax=Artemisia annua TaxID=35608 RepID=A0A2U1LZN0_ARTAN|nr:Pentatricopeptide repeat-containing protein [Artemisia annua]
MLRHIVSDPIYRAKTKGRSKHAENFIEKIPESFKGELICRTLLANCVQVVHTTKAVQLLNIMEQENMKPSHFTYRMLIDIKDQSNDLEVMEQKTMKHGAGFQDTRDNLHVIGVDGSVTLDKCYLLSRDETGGL